MDDKEQWPGIKSVVRVTSEYDAPNSSFTPESTVDTFKIEAVNYCFAKSKISNLLYYNEGTITTSLPIVREDKKVEISGNNHSICIDVFEKDAFPVTVRLVSLEGKMLFHKTFKKTDQIILHISKYAMNVFIVQVKFQNECYSEKVIVD
jgi:hypothetical protein